MFWDKISYFSRDPYRKAIHIEKAETADP